MSEELKPCPHGEAVEVVAWRWKTEIPEQLRGSDWVWSFGSHWSTGPKDAEQLMTVDQHERIVGSLRTQLHSLQGAGEVIAEVVSDTKLPDGWKLVAVNSGFDDLMYWLDRCEHKGHLDNCGDLIEPWEKFDYRTDLIGLNTAPPAIPADPDMVQVPRNYPFAKKIISKLNRFNECAEDPGADGVDIGRHWLDLLTQLGLLNRVQRSPALWEISQQGEDAILSSKGNV